MLSKMSDIWSSRPFPKIGHYRFPQDLYLQFVTHTCDYRPRLWGNVGEVNGRTCFNLLAAGRVRDHVVLFCLEKFGTMSRYERSVAAQQCYLATQCPNIASGVNYMRQKRR
jgi:hypothetical protein